MCTEELYYNCEFSVIVHPTCILLAEFHIVLSAYYVLDHLVLLQELPN